jgi:hypothetical protein
VAQAGEPAAAARAEIDQLLQDADWPTLTQRLHGSVAMAPLAGGDARIVDRTQALAWLRERWQPTVRILVTDEVEAMGLLTMTSAPWLPAADGGARVQLNAHRYDRSGQPHPSGVWLIDTILYEEATG